MTTIDTATAQNLLSALNRCATALAIHEQGPLACIAEMRRVCSQFGLTEQLRTMESAVLTELAAHDRTLAPATKSIMPRKPTTGISTENLLISIAVECRLCLVPVMHECEDMLRDLSDAG